MLLIQLGLKKVIESTSLSVSQKSKTLKRETSQNKTPKKLESLSSSLAEQEIQFRRSTRLQKKIREKEEKLNKFKKIHARKSYIPILRNSPVRPNLGNPSRRLTRLSKSPSSTETTLLTNSNISSVNEEMKLRRSSIRSSSSSVNDEASDKDSPHEVLQNLLTPPKNLRSPFS